MVAAVNGRSKRCTICKEVKPVEGFNYNATKGDGLQTHCRDCNRRICRMWRKMMRRRHRMVAAAERETERALLRDFYRAAVPASAVLAGAGDDTVRQVVLQQLQEAVLQYCSIFDRW
jgi:hypothetical protein